MQNALETISFNGQLLPRAELTNCQTTRCTIIYEVVRLINGIPLFWEGHWARLQNNLISIHSKIRLDKTDFEQKLAKFIRKNKLVDTNIRFEVFGENVLYYAIPVNYPTPLNYQQGVSLNFIEAIRAHPTQKILRRKWKTSMESKIIRAGVYESLMLNNEGIVTEGTHTNVFFIKDKTLFSAAEELILPGITRLEVLNIAKQEALLVEYTSLNPETIFTYDAAFLCATSLHILPIKNINETKFDVNNAVLRTMMHAFSGHIEENIKSESFKWLQ